MRLLRWILASLAAAAFTMPANAALTIGNVQPSRTQIEAGGSVDLRFHLEEPALVTLNIYDGRDLLVRRVVSATVLPAGDSVLTWDGKDEAGRVVPDEAYTFTLTAEQGARTVVWDLADADSGANFAPREVKWDEAAGRIRYILDAPARVNVRVGFQDNGPLLRTVVDWVARPAGPNEESWDGWDASSVLKIANHPKLDIAALAFRLPQNTVLVGPPALKVATIDVSGWTKSVRPRRGTNAPRRMYSHGQQSLGERGDFSVRLVLPDSLPRSADGLPIIRRAIPVRLEIPQSDVSRALARRFEPIFFLDGQFVFENEVGFVPMTWNWDPASVNPGPHYLTVNLRGYEGNFGMATVKVLVERQ